MGNPSVLPCAGFYAGYYPEPPKPPSKWSFLIMALIIVSLLFLIGLASDISNDIGLPSQQNIGGEQ